MPQMGARTHTHANKQVGTRKQGATHQLHVGSNITACAWLHVRATNACTYAHTHKQVSTCKQENTHQLHVGFKLTACVWLHVRATNACSHTHTHTHTPTHTHPHTHTHTHTHKQVSTRKQGATHQLHLGSNLTACAWLHVRSCHKCVLVRTHPQAIEHTQTRSNAPAARRI